jgi:hypothetical protein
VANRGPGAANPTNGPLAAWVELATDLATELSGTGWLSEGSAGTTRPEIPNRSGLGYRPALTLCKTVYPGSIPGVASIKFSELAREVRLVV